MSNKKDQKPKGEAVDDPIAASFAAFEAFSKSMLDAGQQAQDMVAGTMPDIAKTVQVGAEKAAGPPPNPDPFGLAPDFAEVFGKIATNPDAVLKAQTALWQGYGALWASALQKASGETAQDTVKPAPGDRRWRAADWSENPTFDLIKQSYLLSSNWLNDLVASAEGVDPKVKKKVAFFTQQMTDAFAPTNFAMTNPEVIKATLQSEGENLKKGMENLARDMKSGGGALKVSQTDTKAYEIGVDVATAPGKVMFENDILQLLQFEPSTETTYSRPLVIFPPWINKYYILDLRAEQSMIRWLTDKGYTVFVVSWVNPDPSLKDKNFEDYMSDGVYAALDAVAEATGEQKVNAVGYCIGGTLLATTLAHMAAKGDTRIGSATFFAAQSDFEEAGDLLVFCDEAGIAEIERKMDEAGGVLDGSAMAETFNMLRSNDLIWSNIISNYMLGRSPRAFDLLFWNADSTRMPKALHLFYLNQYYRLNAFAKGQMVLGGVKLDPTKIDIPMYVQSSREDHIAPYSSVYRGARLYGGALSGKIRFTMAGSGHIAGVINAPSANKYQHWINKELPDTVEEWIAGAEMHEGSWWPDWHKWLSRRSGKKVYARKPGDGKLKPIEDAPGRYVKVKS